MQPNTYSSYPGLHLCQTDITILLLLFEHKQAHCKQSTTKKIFQENLAEINNAHADKRLKERAENQETMQIIFHRETK